MTVATRSKSYYPARMSDNTNPLWPEFPPTRGSRAPADTPPRYETVNRTQIELTPTDLEALLPPGHAARLVWRFVEGLDLSAFYATIRAREGRAGRPPIDPKILIALWLYATIDGVGSAREVDRLCYGHEAYRWLRGGVSVNYHTLSDFRVDHHVALDDLLTQSIATLRHRGVVTLARVAQDGMRIRASAGAGSLIGRDVREGGSNLRDEKGGSTRLGAGQARARIVSLLSRNAAMPWRPRRRRRGESGRTAKAVTGVDDRSRPAPLRLAASYLDDRRSL